MLLWHQCVVGWHPELYARLMLNLATIVLTLVCACRISWTPVLVNTRSEVLHESDLKDHCVEGRHQIEILIHWASCSYYQRDVVLAR